VVAGRLDRMPVQARRFLRCFHRLHEHERPRTGSWCARSRSDSTLPRRKARQSCDRPPPNIPSRPRR
jgi:hypothetical protein